MRTFKSAMAAVLLTAAMALPSAAETGTEILFDRSQLAAVEGGTVLDYGHSRDTVETVDAQAIEDGGITVLIFEKDGTRWSKVTLKNGASKRALQHFPAASGNPIFVTFLESTLAAVARATKGSPFYLRNRFKDALAGGGTVSKTVVTLDGREAQATQIEYTPFATDKNHDKLGAFADLVIVFTVSDAVPGRFLHLSAKTKSDAYSEDIRYRGLTTEE